MKNIYVHGIFEMVCPDDFTKEEADDVFRAVCRENDINVMFLTAHEEE